MSLGPLTVTSSGSRAGEFSVSETGDLVYRAAPSIISRLVWLDREGRGIGTLGEPAAYGDLFLSQDGRRVAVSIDTGGATKRDVWVFDTVRGGGDRLTSDAGGESGGVFSPDGDRIAFNSARAGGMDLYVKPTTGSGSDVVVRGGRRRSSTCWSWSPDSQFLLYITNPAVSVSADMWTVPASGNRTPTPFLHTKANEGFAAMFSPDGRSIAFPSDEWGRFEVYVARFPADAASGRVRVSTAGGLSPRWGAESRELFYFEPDSGRMMTVPLTFSGNGVKAAPRSPCSRSGRRHSGPHG